MIKKLFSAFFVMALVTVFLASTGSAQASNSPSWHWTIQEVSPFVYLDVPVDDRCDNSNPAFRVTVFEGHNYTGARARICGYWDDLSQLPQYKGANAPSFNNSISSVWVKELPAGSYFAQFYFLKDQEGDYFLSSVAKTDLSASDDNKISSVKRTLFGY